MQWNTLAMRLDSDKSGEFFVERGKREHVVELL